MEPIKRMNRELVFEGSILNVYKDTVCVSNGNLSKWDFVGKCGAAAALPITDDGKIILVKQWRNALDRFTVEIPAGGQEPSEEMITCAMRELEEETGYKAGNMDFLVSVEPTVAFCNERIDVFLATNLIKTHTNFDEEEEIELCLYSMEELLDMIDQGTLRDSKTVAAILAYYRKTMKQK